MLREKGLVKRCDLTLRTKYLGLETEIFELEPFSFVIYCKNYCDYFEDISSYFNQSIKIAGVGVALVKKRPEIYLCLIENISMSNIVDGFKASVITFDDLDNFIRSKFHDVDILKVEIPEEGLNYRISIHVSPSTNETRIAEMTDFLTHADIGTDDITIKKSFDSSDNLIARRDKSKYNNALKHVHLYVDKSLPFTINEADYWYENAENIYNGCITRNDLSFFRQNSLKCYLDFSSFNNINLRNVLLIYDTVCISLPLEKNLPQFLEHQDMNLSELIELVEMGKVVVFLPHQENSYDKKLLIDLYNCDQNAIVGRYGINTLIASYFIDIKNQFEKRFPKINDLASFLNTESLRNQNPLIQTLANIVTWPITAAANSFMLLNNSSPIFIGSIGVNKVIADTFKEHKMYDNLKFELNVNSLSTHMSAALQSTYFPFVADELNSNSYSDAFVSKVMSDYLKMYNYDMNKLENINTINRENEREHNYLELFDCKNNTKITRVARLADDYHTPEGFRNLLSNLDKMDPQTRKQRLRDYNDLLDETKQITNKKNYDPVLFTLGALGFLPLDYKYSLLLSMIGVLKNKVDDTDFIKKHSELKNIEKIIHESGLTANNLTHDVYLLDKISSVVVLK